MTRFARTSMATTDAAASRDIPIDPARLVVQCMIDAADPDRILDPSAAGWLVIETPSAKWDEVVACHWKEMVHQRMAAKESNGDIEAWEDYRAMPGRRHLRMAAEPIVLRDTNHHGTDEVEDLADAAWRGVAVVGVSSDPAHGLPPALLDRARLVRLVLPGPDTIQAVIFRLTGGRPRARLAPARCHLLTPAVLRLACERGITPDAFQARVETSLARSTPVPPAVPADDRLLSRLHGMEEAAAWGRSLATDIRAWCDGRLPWTAVDKGILLAGPPGSGKTTLARAIAEAGGLAFHATSAVGLLARDGGEGHLGDFAHALKEVMADAREAAPSLILLDEVEAFASRSGPHSRFWGTATTYLLELLDGSVPRDGVVVVGATNLPELVDPALVRPGRLDRTILVPLPDRRAMAAILRDLTGGGIGDAVLVRVAGLLAGRSAAEAGHLVRSAERVARHDGRGLEAGDLLAACGTLILAPPSATRH